MASKLEELLKILNNGGTLDNYVPTSRLEKHLIACINKTGCDNLKDPTCRAEALLQIYAKKCKNSIDNIDEVLTDDY